VSELNLILLGPPGAGKGTQATRLRDDFDLAYIATGDLLRKHVKEQTDLGKEAKSYMAEGGLVPDKLVIKMIFDKVELERRGRKLTAALLVDAPDDVVIERLSGRRQCSNEHLYHVTYDPPKHEGKCDQCGRPLHQRDDDRPEVIAKRLKTYHEQTEPLKDYYEEHGLLRRFDGTRDKNEVHDHIRATLATLRLEERL
jgi:adenylate kinase